MGSWAFSFGPWASDPVPFDVTARRLAEAGYDGIGVSGFPPHITTDKYPDKNSRSEVARFLTDLRLGISGYAADFSFVSPVAPENETKYLDLMKRNVEMCVDLGAPALRVDTVAAPGSIDDAEYEAVFRRVARLWSESAGFAESAGVKLVWEFEPGFLFNKPSETIRMHKAVGHSNFFLVFDTAHAHMCAVEGARQQGKREVLTGGVHELLEKLDGRIGLVHIVDSDGTLYHDETSTHCALGEGLINFEKLAPKLLALPNVEWWTVDLCFRPGSWDLVESSRRFVAGLLERHA